MQSTIQNPDEELKLRRREISSNPAENLLLLIQAQRRKFLELIEDDELKKSFLKTITDFYSNPDNLNGTFKDKIDNASKNCFANPDNSTLMQGDAEFARKKLELNKVSSSLAKIDPSFVKAILPEVNQLRPRVPFKGWGLDVRFEDNKISIDGKEVSEIRNHLNKNIIEDLRIFCKNYPNNPELFPLGVMDFFRNAESAQLIYADPNIQPRPLEKSNKKTLICDDSREGFKILQPSNSQTNVDESEFLRARINAYCGILKGSKATASPQKAPTSEPPLPDRSCFSPLTCVIQRAVRNMMSSPAKPESQEQKPRTTVSRRLVDEAAKYSYRFGEAVFLVATMGIRPGASGAAGMSVF